MKVLQPIAFNKTVFEQELAVFCFEFRFQLLQHLPLLEPMLPVLDGQVVGGVGQFQRGAGWTLVQAADLSAAGDRSAGTDQGYRYS